MITLEGVNPKMIANNLEPFEPTHPGELLEDELECRGVSPEQFASDTGIPISDIHHILQREAPVSAETALLCERALGIPAHILIELQSDYDLITAKRNSSFIHKLASVRKIAAAL